MAKSLIILDPGMRQRAGHYFEFNTSLAGAARAAGYAVKIYAHKTWSDAEPDILSHFTTGVGQDSVMHGFGHKILALLPPFLRKILFAPARVIYRAMGKNNTDNKFVSEVKNLSLPEEGAIILCPSASYDDILSMISYCAGSQNQWRFVLRQKPQNKTDEKAFAALASKTISPNMRILADTNDLAVWLSENNVMADLMPIPMRPPAFVYDSPAPHEIFTFALLGPARKEKGIHLMPDLVRAFAEELKQNKVRFFIQTTLIGGQAPEPETEDAIVELEKLQKQLPNIILESGDLTEDEFYRALCDASCLLVPYDRKRYEARSSGLLVQSFLCARPAIVPQGTWMADQMPDFMHGLIWDNDLEGVCRTALSSAIEMTEFTQLWRSLHTPDGVLRSLGVQRS